MDVIIMLNLYIMKVMYVSMNVPKYFGEKACMSVSFVIIQSIQIFYR